MFARPSPLLLIALGLLAPARADEPKPIKVLWCTGGGFHDFKGLTPLLTKSIREHANARFDVSDDYKAWAKPGFADGYDAVVLFFSHHDKEAQAVVDNLAATIRAGKPAVVIHSTLHAFLELGAGRDAYCEAIGLASVAHDPKRPLATKKVADHPILAAWPGDWSTPSDELYQVVKIWPGAMPLLTACCGPATSSTRGTSRNPATPVGRRPDKAPRMLAARMESARPRRSLRAARPANRVGCPGAKSAALRPAGESLLSASPSVTHGDDHHACRGAYA